MVMKKAKKGGFRNKNSFLFHECFSFSKRKGFFSNERFNEFLTFLLIFIIFLIAIKLGPMITGFAVFSHSDDTDFTGTSNRTNKLNYLTKQVKNRGVK